MAAIVEGMHADAAEADAAAATVGGGERTGRRWELSPNSVLGTLAAALVTAMFGVLMWQIDSLGDRIDGNSDRIDSLGTELRGEMGRLETELRGEIGKLATELRAEFRAEIGGLRAEMQAGFREINVILLDHTDRLARLEAAAGLPRPGD